MLRVVLVLVLASTGARAEVPIAIKADVGLSKSLAGAPLRCYADWAPTRRPVLDLDVAYRFVDQLALGIHAGARNYPWEECGGNTQGYQRYRSVHTALRVGVGVHWSKSRFWLSAWFGTEYRPDEDRDLAFAIGGGVDVYVHPSGHRVGVYLDLTETENYFDERHVSAGIAYRFW